MSYHQSFWNDICDAADGERIEAVVIGHSYGLRDLAPYERRVITADQARQILSYHYDDGFGGVECHAIYAWTASRVLFVSQYDGSTGIESVPRNPVACDPEMPGG